MSEELKTEESQEKSSQNKPARDEKGRLLPGNTANPYGKPKGATLNLTKILKEQLEEFPDGKTEAYKTLFIKKLLHKALVEGDIQAIKIIINYVDGLPKQTIEGLMTNLNFDYNELSDDELKTRIREYSGELRIEGAEEKLG